MPFSGDSESGAAVVRNGWGCTNEACTASIMLRKGQRVRAQIAPPPAPEPSPNGSTWLVCQHHTTPEGAPP